MPISVPVRPLSLITVDSSVQSTGLSFYTDASLEGTGAVMKQKQNNGNFKPVAYFSKKLNKYQKKKKASFFEYVAIKEALNYSWNSF